MSFPGDYEMGSKSDESYAHALPSMTPLSGSWISFPAQPETRRDSVASTLASTSSSASRTSESSGPLTPVNDDGYVGVMPYFCHGYQSNQPAYTMPGEEELLQHGQQTYEDSWDELSPGDFIPEQFGPPLHHGDPHHVPELGFLDMGHADPMADAVPTSSTWTNNDTTAHIDATPNWTPNWNVTSNDPLIHSNNFGWMWDPPFVNHAVATTPDQLWTQVQLPSSSTMIPNPLEDSKFPPSPQFKQESDDEEYADFYYVEHTGAKKVNKERKSSEPTRPSRSRRRTRARPYSAIRNQISNRHAQQLETYTIKTEDSSPHTINVILNGVPSSKHRCTHPACDKVFKRIEHMKRHYRTHVDVRPYGCIICEKRFGRKDNCKDHYATHVPEPGTNKHKKNRQIPLDDFEKAIRGNNVEDGEKIIQKAKVKAAGGRAKQRVRL